jgi:RimJ/RimL family protein N-acetyltransferase
MQAFWVEDPSAVWKEIESYLVDDGKKLVTQGQFLGVSDYGKPAGAFLIKPMNDYCYEIHGGVAKAYWGKGVEICTTMGLFLFNHTPCLKIVAIVPKFNRLMCKCLENTGLKQEGVLTKSFMKRFKMHDQIIYGITKQEARICRQQQ